MPTMTFPALAHLSVGFPCLFDDLAMVAAMPALKELALFMEPMDQNWATAFVTTIPWPTVTNMIINRRAFKGSDELLQIDAAVLDALPHLTVLTLLSPIKWLDETAPTLVFVTHLTTSFRTLAAFSRTSLPRLVHLTFNEKGYAGHQGDTLPALPMLHTIRAQCIPPSLIEQLMRAPRLTRVRIARIDPGAGSPPPILHLEYRQGHQMWRALPTMSAKHRIADMLVIDVAHVVDADAAATEIEAVIRWAAKGAREEKEAAANKRQTKVGQSRTATAAADAGNKRPAFPALEHGHDPLLAVKCHIAAGVGAEFVDRVKGMFAELQELRVEVKVLLSC
ncbi:hypothetical protein AMAG_11019 [Allomyces macrogynus ATCC 38327]|uniref:F-box domain-containing protein n=1 Tax=Allomyces macrogynus (strain ATCC 38327) TaxID=578462 RepID=A0A0L0SS57_ALLM3|nr:hypothetical protein AMAG_11019 [Allomyces macrogynus ATCC 38327]|eukprot:KNE65383.1 hypothetical protein AMAG_11019 [Allomyces macrogynus ATCC 38327]